MASRQNDCSGVISAVAFGIFTVLGSLLLFYLLSGPPTFLERVTMSPGDTIFHNFTWSRMWCQCAKFLNVNNHTPADVLFYRFPESFNPPLSKRIQYQVSQQIQDPYQEFEYWEVYFHPGSQGVANFSFNIPVSFYFAPRYYVDGEDHDADYSDHSILTFTNVTQGTITTPPFTSSGGWAFVWEKDFKLQASTFGNVTYWLNLTEYDIPSGGPAPLAGEGSFCWDTGAPNDAWMLAAKSEALNQLPRLEADLWCVPRYELSAPITAIPVVIAVVLEILIIIFCIVKPRRRVQGYSQIN